MLCIVIAEDRHATVIMEKDVMSHLCIIQTILRDPDAIMRACHRLGWPATIGGKVRFYGGPSDECTYTVELGNEVSQWGRKLSDTYNMGIQRQQDGTYSILVDNAMGCAEVERDTSKQIGETPRIVGAFLQAYNYAVLEAEAALAGYALESQTAP
jgi:hypothetical protein